MEVLGAEMLSLTRLGISCCVQTEIPYGSYDLLIRTLSMGIYDVAVL